jgi:hypothetical protein
MAETEIDEYKLDTNQGKKQHTLRVSLINGRVSMIIVNMKNTKEKFSNLIRLEQFRNACEAFDQTKTILDAINLIKTTIEEGHILLSEDEEAKNIDIKFNVHLGKKDYPPFVIGLPSDDPEEEEEVKKEVEVKNDNAKENDVEVLPTKFDYQGDMQAAVKYGKSTKNTTEYANPIIKSNVKEPNLILEYIEPILQVHYPDGTTKSTALPPRLQTADGKEPNINPEQLKSLHEQMARNFSQGVSEFEKENNRSNSVSHKSTSAYSRQTVTSFGNNNILGQSINNMNIQNNNFNNNINNLNAVRSAMKPEVNFSNFNNNTLNNIKATRTAFNPYDNERGSKTNASNKNLAPRDNLINYKKTPHNIKGMSEYSISSVPNKPLVIPGYYGTIPNPTIKNNLNNSTNLNYSQNQNIQEIPRIINQNMNYYPDSNLYQRGMNRSSSSPSIATLDKVNHNFYQQNQSQTQFNFPQNPSQSYIQNQINNVNLRYQNLNLNQSHNPHLNQNQYLNSSQNFVNRSINFNNNPEIQNNMLTRHNSSQTPLVSQSMIYQMKNQKQQELAQQRYQDPQILQEQKKMQMLQEQQRQKLILQKSQNSKLIPKKNHNQIAQNSNQRDANLLNRPGLKIQPPQAQNHQINIFQQKQSQPIERSRNPIKEIHPTLKQSFSQQIIRQKPSFKNEITKQQIALAQMASLQNLQNPGNFNASTVSLQQKFLDKEGNEETQSQYEREDEELEQRKKEPEQPQQQEEQSPINEADVFENLYRTEEGYIIFRNGLLQGIIHKFAEITDVVSKIQIMFCAGVKFNLLFRASEHSDKAKVFHEKCDKHQVTLVLVETTKGVRFGGFTTETWDGNCVKKVDNNAFVFSLDKHKIYDVRKNEYAIGGYPKFGPVFFGCQIRVYDEFFKKGGTTCHKGLNYKTREDYELNNGEQKYIVKEIEVYDVEVIRMV